ALPERGGRDGPRPPRGEAPLRGPGRGRGRPRFPRRDATPPLAVGPAPPAALGARRQPLLSRLRSPAGQSPRRAHPGGARAGAAAGRSLALASEAHPRDNAPLREGRAPHAPAPDADRRQPGFHDPPPLSGNRLLPPWSAEAPRLVRWPRF